MTHRTFRDAAGYEWAVWDVYPIAPERRQMTRRRLVVGDHSVVERRRGADRRQRRMPRAVLGAEYNDGWLCFETTGIRRRLAPIPTGWDAWDARKLEECCQRATPVVRRVAG